MDIDVSSLTFRDASSDEKKRIFRILNLRNTIWLVCALIAIAAVFLIPGRVRLLTAIGLGLAAVVLLYIVIEDMPAWHCRVCKGIVSNKREIQTDTDTGLYYDAVTFTSEKGEVVDVVPVFSAKTLHLLEEGSHATIVCYNKRQPVLLADEQIHEQE
ncbi:MAG: hypothetical protein J5636_07390 [Clostridiales bacterium]|nr:hypothetical protein [Clostridiales bacterium]